MEESIVSNHDYILYSDFRTINDKGVFQKDTILEYKGPVWFSDEIFKSCPIGFTGVWIPQSILNRVGTFEERLSCCEDYEWMLRAVSLGVPFRKIPKILYSKRHHPDRTTIKEYKNIPSIVDNLRRKYD
jgi:GT2 family glycosyltransferase